MSAATEKRILDFAHALMLDVENKINKEWGSPPSGGTYTRAVTAFREQVELRIRSNEWMKE